MGIYLKKAIHIFNRLEYTDCPEKDVAEIWHNLAAENCGFERLDENNTRSAENMKIALQQKIDRCFLNLAREGLYAVRVLATNPGVKKDPDFNAQMIGKIIRNIQRSGYDYNALDTSLVKKPWQMKQEIIGLAYGPASKALVAEAFPTLVQVAGSRFPFSASPRPISSVSAHSGTPYGAKRALQKAAITSLRRHIAQKSLPRVIAHPPADYLVKPHEMAISRQSLTLKGADDCVAVAITQNHTNILMHITPETDAGLLLLLLRQNSEGGKEAKITFINASAYSSNMPSGAAADKGREVISAAGIRGEIDYLQPDSGLAALIHFGRNHVITIDEGTPMPVMRTTEATPRKHRRPHP